MVHPRPAIASRRVTSLQSYRLLLVPFAGPHIDHLWATRATAFIIRVKDVAIVINKRREVNLCEKLSLLSPELPWLAGEHGQDLVLDQRQLFWAPGHDGCGATELMLAVLVYTGKDPPSPLCQVNWNGIYFLQKLHVTKRLGSLGHEKPRIWEELI